MGTTDRRRRLLRWVFAGILVGALTSATSASVAVAPDATVTRLRQLADVRAGYSLGAPHVLAASSGAVLVAWNEYGVDPHAVRLFRKVRSRGFSEVTVPQAGLVSIGEVYLTEDPVNDRILMTAEAHGPTLDDLGLYVWTSTTNGRTWSSPTRVWDSFATGQIALDRAGGFWAITDQTWAVVAHVPASLDLQQWPDDHVVLTDRFASRGAIDLATTGTMRRLLFAWGSGASEAWVHIGSAADLADDVRVMKGLEADGSVSLAGDRRAALLGAIRRVATTSGNADRLFASRIVASRSGTVVGRPQQVSAKGEDVVDFALASIPSRAGNPTGEFRAVWRSSDGRLRTSRTRLDATAWTRPTTIVAFPAQHLSYPSNPDLSAGWVALGAYRGGTAPVQVAASLPSGP